MHTVPAAYFAQPPWPLQSPLAPQVSARSATHTPLGSGLPSGMGAHSPILPGSVQLTHAPAQARLQHTPSEQCPESHSFVLWHEAPSGFLPQLPWSHVRPSHCALVAQAAWH